MLTYDGQTFFLNTHDWNGQWTATPTNTSKSKSKSKSISLTSTSVTVIIIASDLKYYDVGVMFADFGKQIMVSIFFMWRQRLEALLWDTIILHEYPMDTLLKNPKLRIFHRLN